MHASSTEVSQVHKDKYLTNARMYPHVLMSQVFAQVIKYVICLLLVYESDLTQSYKHLSVMDLFIFFLSVLSQVYMNKCNV